MGSTCTAEPSSRCLKGLLNDSFREWKRWHQWQPNQGRLRTIAKLSLSDKEALQAIMALEGPDNEIRDPQKTYAHRLTVKAARRRVSRSLK